MTWKIALDLRGVRLFVNVDRIGMRLWMLAVLIIGLSLAIQLNAQPNTIDLLMRCVRLLGLAGLALISIGVLHILRLHYSAKPARYARAALCPLWYHSYGAPANTRRSIMFDHGQACAWGLESLLAAATIHAALQLAAGQPIWRSAAVIAVLAATYTTLSAVRDHVAAHGHDQLIMRNA